MLPEVKSLLVDIQHSIAGIDLFMAGKSRDDFMNDLMFRRAVERQFEIIGEAMNRLRKVDPLFTDRISEYRGIISFRNVLIHGYDKINDDVTWQIIENRLPILRNEIDALLKVP